MYFTLLLFHTLRVTTFSASVLSGPSRWFDTGGSVLMGTTGNYYGAAAADGSFSSAQFCWRDPDGPHFLSRILPHY